MATFANLGFETAGTDPGEAGSWTSSFTGGVQAFGDFSGGAPAAPRPHENFEAGWSSNEDYLSTLASGDVTLAQFNTGDDATAFEAFEVEWSNDTYQSVITTAAGATFTGALDAESFQSGWSTNEDYLSTLASGDVTVGQFTYAVSGMSSALQGFEAFEGEWDKNQDNVSTLGSGDVTVALFDEGATAYETFAAVLAPFPFSLDSDIFQAAAHPLSNGNRVRLTGPGLPSHIVVGLTYYVINKTSNTFQVSLTLGGSAVVGDGSSSTSMRVVGDPAVYWVEAY